MKTTCNDPNPYQGVQWSKAFLTASATDNTLFIYFNIIIAFLPWYLFSVFISPQPDNSHEFFNEEIRKRGSASIVNKEYLKTMIDSTIAAVRENTTQIFRNQKLQQHTSMTEDIKISPQITMLDEKQKKRNQSKYHQ